MSSSCCIFQESFFCFFVIIYHGSTVVLNPSFNFLIFLRLTYCHLRQIAPKTQTAKYLSAPHKYYNVRSTCIKGHHYFGGDRCLIACKRNKTESSAHDSLVLCIHLKPQRLSTGLALHLEANSTAVEASWTKGSNADTYKIMWALNGSIGGIGSWENLNDGDIDRYVITDLKPCSSYIVLLAEEKSEHVTETDVDSTRTLPAGERSDKSKFCGSVSVDVKM